MREKIRGIVLANVRHSDRHNVVTLFTQERGRMAFVTSGSSTKGGRMRNALLQPLSVIGADVSVDATRDLQRLGAFDTPRLWMDLYASPRKMGMALFISEFLTRLLRESPPDEPLYKYLETTIAILDALPDEQTDNFHLAFLWHLLSPMGIEPDLSAHTPHATFDLRAGCYCAFPPLHPDTLRDQEAAIPRLLSTLRFDNLGDFHPTAAGYTRAAMLTFLLRYYAIHFPGVESLRSPSILRQILS